MIKSTSAILLGFLLFLGAGPIAAVTQSTDVDRLVAILVAKGTLTKAEAAEILGELDRVPVVDLRSQQTSAPRQTRAARVPPGISISGDLRLRVQSDDRTGLPQRSQVSEEADEARFRWRLGVDIPIQERWQAGFGLTSGGSDPRSNNQTFSEGFETYHALQHRHPPGLTEHAVPTNSRNASGNLVYDYDAATLSGAVSWKPPALVQQAEWFGGLIHATDPGRDNIDWLAGVRFGDQRLDQLWA